MVKHRVLVLSLALIWLVGSSLPVSSQPAINVSDASSIQEVRSLAVVQDQTGDLWTAWEADTGTDVEIIFSRWTGQGWSAPKPVHSRPKAWDRSPSLTIAANGEVWLAWSSAEMSNPEQSKIYVTRWTGGRWTGPEAVPMGAISEAKEPALATLAISNQFTKTERLLAADTQDNSLWLAWVGFDGTDDEVFVNRWDGASWLPPQQVSFNDDQPFQYDRQPQIATGGDGRPWVVWTSHQDGVDDEIVFSHWTGDGWTPEEMISQDDDGLDISPSLALDAQDQPWVVWEGTVSEGEEMYSRVLVSRWDAGRSAWTSEATVSSPPLANVNETSPTLAFSPHGQMHLTWVAGSLVGSALAHAQGTGRQQTAPQLVTTGVPDAAAALTFTANGSAIILHLAPSSEDRVPVERMSVEDREQPLAGWIEAQLSPEQILTSEIENRHLAFGDSITWGWYVDRPYPISLENTLDSRVVDSEVINRGVPGETTYAGKQRIVTDIPTYLPRYLLYMMGTNDVSKDRLPSKVKTNIKGTIKLAKNSAVPNLRILVATIIPRADDRYRDTVIMNQEAIIPAAEERDVPWCDQWQAFRDYGPWEDIMLDAVHPDQAGLDLMADTFYDCLLDNWLDEEDTAPVTWIEPLPPTGYSRSITVSWNGTDNLSWVVDYDVQVKVNNGAWTNWLLSTQDTSDTYTDANYGDTVSFRVRGRDVVGNESVYGTAQSTQVLTPIYVHQLPAYQVAPFPVSWSVRDPLFYPDGYEVEYNVNGGTWQDWLVDTTATSGDFDPPSPQYSQYYCFRARAKANGEWLPPWSDQECTRLARYAVRGQVHNVRHEPIIGAEVSLAPAPTYLDREAFGRFSAYLMAGGDYEITASRDDLFGNLPAMPVTVTNNVEGLDFVLPPQDNVVSNGGFEEESLSSWQVGGTLPPTLTAEVHTGNHAVILGGLGESSWLTQTLTVPTTLTDATLSLMVKLDDDGAGSNTLDIELVGTPISHTQQVSTDSWTHVWIPVDAALGEAITLTLTVSDNPAIFLDEVSLGTAAVGGNIFFLPYIGR